MMLKEFFQVFLKLFLLGRFKVFICFFVAFCASSCVKDSYEDGRQYKYSHYPNKTYKPNSRYYGRPYELSPKRYPTDYDQYYVPPYGYGYGDNASPADSKL